MAKDRIECASCNRHIYSYYEHMDEKLCYACNKMIGTNHEFGVIAAIKIRKRRPLVEKYYQQQGIIADDCPGKSYAEYLNETKDFSEDEAQAYIRAYNIRK